MSEKTTALPEIIHTEEELEEVMTRPSASLVEFVRSLESPLVILGAGGKMGPTMSILARRAAAAAGAKLDIVAVSRFSDKGARTRLEENGVRTLSAELLDRDSFKGLPETSNLLYLVGFKFGSTENPEMTWATNTLVPQHVCERYPEARIAAVSTGNVYPLVPVADRGSVETDDLTPIGEYGNACVARERLFEFFSKQNGTPVALIRLSYALDLRYGVLADICLKVEAGEPVDVTMGYVKCIWQGDANDMIIRSLAVASAPPMALNLTGAGEVLSVRELALRFGELLNREVQITGTEEPSAFFSSAERASELLGEPPTPLDTVLRWTAHWIRQGGRMLGKPTHFDTRDGKY